MMKNKIISIHIAIILLSGDIISYAEQKLPPPPPPPSSQLSHRNKNDGSILHKNEKNKDKKELKNNSMNSNSLEEKIPHGKELVSIDFPNGVNLGDIIKTVGVWTGKNFVLGQGVSGGSKISIISQDPVTKEEAYQAFLSALNISGFTTVETGKIVKILPISNAKSANIKTYYGENWAPATDEIINHVIPLHYIDVNSVINQLRPLLGLTQYAPFTTTNSLILTDTGNRIRRILEVIKLLDDKKSQSQVSIVPINYSDAKDMATKVTDIFGNRAGTIIALQKALVDERTNSIILVGPARTLDDIVRFIHKIDKPILDQTSQALIRVRPLDYADAEKLAQTLQALSQNTNSSKSGANIGQRPPYLPPLPNAPNQNSSPSSTATIADLSNVKITADVSTNSLILQGSKAAYNELDQIISQLDRRKAQVYIEANIVDLNISHDLNWTPVALGGGSTSNVTVPFGLNAGRAVPFTVQKSNSTDPTSAFNGLGSNAILGILSNKSVSIGGYSLSPGALIFALKTDSDTNVLQTPSMMVSDNETANFQSAQEYNAVALVANPNGAGNVSQPLKYTVTTSLKVTPQISRSDYVNLKIALQLDDANAATAATTGYPNPISKRSADSVVTVQNGQTAVLGGITKNSIKSSESKVPLLGDIPILGWLFKSVNDIKEKTNLTLLVTPHVVRNADDLAKIYEDNMKARDEFLKAFYGERFKNQEFYAQFPKREAGLAPAPKLQNESKDSKEEKVNQNNDFMEQRTKILPSEEVNPINAPTSEPNGTGNNSGALSQTPPALPAQ